MAEIFLARQRGAGGFAKKVVVKRVRREHLDNEEFVKMFLDEARIGALLSHRNVVQVFDFGEDDGTYFLAMEYLVGQDLAQLRKDATQKKMWLPIPVVASAIADACAGLHHAHTAADDEGRPLNLVHRDVSPSNLFVTYDGTIKVLDFGIAKAEGRSLETKTGVLKGKYFYMSPEQIRGDGMTGQSDVFALGACLYELLTCVRPFGRDGELAVIRAILQDDIAPPSTHRQDIPPQVDAVVMRALTRDLSQRYASAAEMRDALFDAVGALSTGDILRDYMLELYGAEEIEARHALDQTGSVSAPDAMLSLGAPLPISDEPETAPSRPNPRSRAHHGEDSAILRPESKKGIWIGTAAAAAIGAAVFGLWVGGFRPTDVDETGDALAIKAPATTPPPVHAVAPTAIAPVVVTPSVPPEGIDKAQDRDAVVASMKKIPTPKGRPVVAPKEKKPERPPVRPPVKKRVKPSPVAAKPARSKMGLVDVNCIPWCKIYVDGKDINKNSPIRGLRLKVGVRVFRLVHPPTGREQTRKVRVGAKTERVGVRF